MSSGEEEAGNNQLPRAQRATRRVGSLGTSTGKIFTRGIDANAHFDSIVDYGLGMWRRQDVHQDEPDDPRSQYLRRGFVALEEIFNRQRVPERDTQTLKTLLRDPIHGVSFRRKLCQSLAKGRSQARSDDKSVLCNLFLKHPELKKCASAGWVDNVCASFLRTKNYNLEDPHRPTYRYSVREQLNLGHSDAPHNEPFAALYEDLAFPNDGDRAFDGYMRNGIFIAALQSVFTGLGSGIGGPGSGERGKGAKAGMTSISPANMAYIAMMLRFVLRRPGNWYNIKPGRKDNRYDYDSFYLATLSFLEEDVYAEEVKELTEFLSRAVFPYSYDHPQVVDVPGGSSMAQLAAEAERIRAERRANDRIDREVAQ
ncbi:hypothetical protein FRC08_002630 [Ceratobasidium sp. 394]|nr:hypothetical protein FRC08_002630 [Ceratobasidium sp. 394]